MSTPTVRWNRYGGVAIAVLGFVISRQFVAQTISPEQSVSALLLMLPPLVVGLGLTVYGVILAVGRFSPDYVRTVTTWCGLGTVGATGLVVLTQLSGIGAGAVDPLAESQLLVANILLGGAIAGVLIGDRSAANSRKRQEIQRTANRAALVNRRLRHDVINAAAIIDGHADLLREDLGRMRSVEAITTAADRIDTTIQEVGQIATPNEDAHLREVDLGAVLSASVSDADTAASTDISVEIDEPSAGLTVMADGRLERLFGELLANAVEYGDGTVTVSVDSMPEAVTIRIEDGGSGLPDNQRRLLHAGEFPEYDDPSAGFGLQAAKLLADRYGGQIQSCGGADADESHRLTVRLPRYAASGSLTDRAGMRLPAVTRAVTAGLIAGVVMGGFYHILTGTMPVIGALYGISSLAVGWVTHLFHSVIFALLFATGCTAIDIEQYVSTVSQAATVGLAWGGVLWFVAAGFVMPAWLLLIGQPATLPALELVGFVGHSVWGITLGASYVLLGHSELIEGRIARLNTLRVD